MKFNSPVYSAVSGSVAGLTYAHNQGGMYTRARAVPTNPSSAQQQAVRNAVLTLSTAWGNTLTAAQRTAWEAYAAAVLMPDALGQPRNIGGIAHYVRSNTPRLQAAVSRIDAGPTDLTLPTFTNPTITVSAAADTASVTFTNTDAWANEVGGYMLVYASSGQNASVNFWKGPYRFAGKITGAGTPPASPATITLPFAVVAGQKVFFQIRVSRADGRLSGPFRTSATAA